MIKTETGKNFDEFVFDIQLICVIFVTLFETLRINALAELALMANFAVAAVLATSAFVKKVDMATTYSWIIIVITSLFSVVVSANVISFGYVKTWLMFMITICLYFWVSATTVTENMVKSFFKAGIIIGLLFIFLYLTGNAYNTDNPYMVSANFGLSNPNLAAIYLLNILLCLLIYGEFSKQKKIKVISVILAAVMFYLIMLTRARACIIAAVAFFALRLLRVKKYSKGLSFFMFMFPLLFVIIYLAAIDSDIMRFFEFATMDGKRNESRVLIWMRKIIAIRRSPVFGDYYNEHGNAHNIYLAILSSYGCITFVFLINFLNTIVNKIGTFIKEKYQILAMFAFYAVIVSGTFEAALFTGSQGMYVFSGGFLMIAKYLTDKNEDTEQLNDGGSK